MNDELTDIIFGTGSSGLITTAALVWWGIGQTGRDRYKRRLTRWLRPNKVRAQHRAGIKQAQSVLRLIASTHYFEENLGETIYGFVTSAQSEYDDAFRRTFIKRAKALLRTQRAWAGAPKPNVAAMNARW